MCSNNSDFKWDNTFNILLEYENSGIKLNNFSTHELTKVACTLSENIVTNIKELELTKLDKATIAAILQIMPVMFLNLGQTSVFINMQEFTHVLNSIEALLSCDLINHNERSTNVANTNEAQTAPLTTLSSQESVKQKGQPFLVKKFLEIIKMARIFIKQHGFSAQCRRRTETGYLSSVSISEIRTQLMKNVPGLIDHGISKSTMRRFFQPPNKVYSAAWRYKSVIDARVGTKSNNFRRYHPNNHFLFCRNKQHCVFCTLFKSDPCIISMDDMAKIKVGAPAAPQYHQIHCLFPTNDLPNFEDQNFPIPNYLLPVSGYMFLEMNPHEEILEEDIPEANNSESYSFWTVASTECKNTSI